MARLGLGRKWECLFANDNSQKKARAYRENFPKSDELDSRGVEELKVSDLPGVADLVWASFPCQDLSLAGARLGFGGARSSTFIPFWKLMLALKRQKRLPPIIVLENVVGAVTSNGGQDFSEILRLLSVAGFQYGPMVLDAVHFVPQSRPRLFIVAVQKGLEIPENILGDAPAEFCTTRRLVASFETQEPKIRRNWIWWHCKEPRSRLNRLEDILEPDQQVPQWNSPDETRRLLSLMANGNVAKVLDARKSGTRKVGAVYRRTRRDERGEKVQRAEVRFDQVSGCLRTPAGGSSRQTILVVSKDDTKSRLLTKREAARLMGVPENYVLPANYNDAYHLFGDGVVVPLVSWLESRFLRPIAANMR